LASGRTHGLIRTPHFSLLEHGGVGLWEGVGHEQREKNIYCGRRWNLVCSAERHIAYGPPKEACTTVAGPTLGVAPAVPHLNRYGLISSGNRCPYDQGHVDRTDCTYVYPVWP